LPFPFNPFDPFVSFHPTPFTLCIPLACPKGRLPLGLALTNCEKRHKRKQTDEKTDRIEARSWGGARGEWRFFGWQLK
jgi:hypothetical protein